MTLGTLSASQANIRSQQGLGMPSKDARKSISTAPRRSMLPSEGSMPESSRLSVGGAGRKSIGGGGGGRPSLGGASGRASMGGRQSLGGNLGRQSLGGTGSMAGGRQSLGRRSSIHASATGSSDPRPLSDKTYRTESIRRLIQFLTENGYNAAISPKILNAPSNKDFVRMFEFLYSHIDRNFAGTDKAEDEIPAMLKMLGYPYTVNKSAILLLRLPAQLAKAARCAHMDC